MENNNNNMLLNDFEAYKKGFKIIKRLGRFSVAQKIITPVFLALLLVVLITYFTSPLIVYKNFFECEHGDYAEVEAVKLEASSYHGKETYYLFETLSGEGGTLVLNKSEAKKLPERIFDPENKEPVKFYGTVGKVDSGFSYNGVSLDIKVKALIGGLKQEKQLSETHYKLRVAATFHLLAVFYVFVNPGDIKKKIKSLNLPVVAYNNKIYVSKADMATFPLNLLINPYRAFRLDCVFKLKGKNPKISLYQDNKKIREYVLQTEEGQSLDGKYFICSILFHKSSVNFPLQIDGFISEDKNKAGMSSDDIGYRFEGVIISGTANADEEIKGKGLFEKGLRYPGYTTPSNVLLVGYCQECKKTFTFHAYSVYMAQDDVAYSDDGQDVCTISDYEIDKENWSYEADGKKFSYYNSFCCPNCGKPYIDYNKYRELKKFGEPACTHLGKKPYTAG